MATLVPAEPLSMHVRTAMLAREAGEAGDDLLKYIYEMALRRIEESGPAPAAETPISAKPSSKAP